MQRVHTYTRLMLPFTKFFTFFKLGNQRVLVLILEWLTLFPVVGRFLQNSQTRDIKTLSIKLLLALQATENQGV